MPVRAKHLLGDLGERLAAQHLTSRGYHIRERNVRTRAGEIDIIADRGGMLVFVEVRVRRGNSVGTASESLTPAKQRRLITLAEAYAQGRDDLPEARRVDVIAIDLSAQGKMLSLQHIEGAVSADVV